MQLRLIDPRDTEIEVTSPTYRVFLWKRQSNHPDAGFESQEYEITDAHDVHEVLDWARANAREGRTFTVYVVVDRTLVQLSGQDPTAVPSS